MAKRRNDAPPPATSATFATRGGRRWIDEGGDELNRWGRWEDEKIEFGSIMDAGFWRDIEKQAEECDRILQQNGLPTAGQSVRYDDTGNWWDRNDPNAPAFELNSGAGGGVSIGCTFAKRQSEPFSDAWYAAFIGGEIWMILKDKAASHEWQLRRVLNIGILSAEWHWRRRFKPSIITGKGVRKGGKLGGEMRAGKYRPGTAKIIKEMERRVADGQSVSRAAEMTAKQGYGTTGIANRKLWQRHRSK